MILVASAASAIEPIRVGVSGPFTGGSSPMGIAMRDGIRLAAQEINDEGGILGRPLQLVERDDEARPERGALVVQELINREKVVAGLGIVNTGVALASQRYYQQARIPMITSVATGSVITKQFLPPQYADNYIFRVSAPDTVQAAMIIEEAVVRPARVPPGWPSRAAGRNPPAHPRRRSPAGWSRRWPGQTARPGGSCRAAGPRPRR